ncbi:MAG: ABC transporter substrate-binding protein [Rhodospirillaceae bacterium]|nr:ABC transporter substrate-binding protein [Rhodospirillaceae bacterium]
MRCLVVAATVCGVLAVPAWAAPAWAAPKRIVSLGSCLDTDIVQLADREQIAALSHYSGDPSTTTIYEMAKGIPLSQESAEEVILFHPDLVLASRHSSLATRNALARLNVHTELFSEPQTVEESIVQLRRVAKLIGHEDRGEAMARRIAEALAEAAPPPGARPLTAVIFQRNGFSTGAQSLVGEMLERTGYVNVATRYGLKSWGYLALEPLIADPPEALLAGGVVDGKPTWADRVLHHPALASAGPRMKRITFPDTLFNCGGPVLIQAAQVLAAGRRSITGEP